jgi:hypothetical protein
MEVNFVGFSNSQHITEPIMGPIDLAIRIVCRALLKI